MTGQADNYKVEGPWIETDGSDHRIELAQTNDPEVIMFRDTYVPDRQTPVRRSHFENMLKAADEGRLNRLGITGTRS